MQTEVLFAGVAVREFDTAVQWYSRLFARNADVVAHDTEVMWQVADAGWLYVVKDTDNAGGSLVAICVPDLDAALAEVSERGIDAPAVEILGDARKATLNDPDGNAVALIQVSAG